LEVKIKKIPILYIYFYIRIKDKVKTEFVCKSKLKEIISRAVIIRGGFPRFMIKYIIQEMVELKLLRKLGSNSYQIIRVPQEKRIRFLINSYL